MSAAEETPQEEDNKKRWKGSPKRSPLAHSRSVSPTGESTDEEEVSGSQGRKVRANTHASGKPAMASSSGLDRLRAPP